MRAYRDSRPVATYTLSVGGFVYIVMRVSPVAFIVVNDDGSVGGLAELSGKQSRPSWILMYDEPATMRALNKAIAKLRRA